MARSRGVRPPGLRRRDHSRKERGRRRESKGWRARIGRRDRGGAVVELAILWPVIMLAVFGGVQVTTYFTARTVALSAAQVGVAAERQHDATPDVGRDRAEEFLATSGDWLVGATVEDPVRTDEEVFVTVRGDALSIVPGVRWEVRQTARGTIERFTGAP